MAIRCSLSLSLLLLLLFLCRSGEAQEHGSEGGEETTTGARPCALKLEELEAAVEEVLPDYELFINCAAYDEEGALETAIVSGFSPSDSSSVRYEFACGLEAVLVGVPLEGNGSRVAPGQACLKCDKDNVTDPCPIPCAADCERCYGTPDESKCSLCTAAEETADACVESCQDGYEINRDNENICEPCNCGFGKPIRGQSKAGVCKCECMELGFTFSERCETCTGVIELEDSFYAVDRGRPSVEEQEEELEEGHLHPEDPLNDPDMMAVGACQGRCTGDNYEPYNISSRTRVCFACGHIYCVECDEEGPCTKCLENTVLFEEECHAGEEADLAVVAAVQEEEVEREEARNRMIQLNLAISLPIVCTAIIVFFITMSVIAHIRYPHISHHGQKRHRRQRPETTGPDPNELGRHATVFRARPTIMLR